MRGATQTLQSRALLRRDEQGRLASRQYHVRVEGRGGRALRVTGPTVVGSGPDAQLRLEEPTVSRRHLELTPTATSLMVRDLGSKNGTFLGGNRITEAFVDRNAVLEAGRCRLSVVVTDEALGPPGELPGFGALVGQSTAMRSLYGLLALVAPTESTVLLTGETGTGKGLIARTLHEQSHRRGGPFVVVECGALGDELADSVLFGHLRGSFTGATRDHEGAFLTAHGGTILLDDVSELRPSVQPRLLRALESRTVQQVGASAAQAVDVRVLATSSKPLQGSNLRSDLYYRLAVIEVAVPPLRDREGDVRLLAEHFAQAAGASALDDDFLAGLERHRWPGNVRELQHAVERNVVLADRLPAAPPPREAPSGDAERERVLAALQACAWNQSAAAKLLGISRGTLISRIERYNLPRPRLKPEGR